MLKWTWWRFHIRPAIFIQQDADFFGSVAKYLAEEFTGPDFFFFA